MGTGYFLVWSRGRAFLVGGFYLSLVRVFLRREEVISSFE